MVTVMFFCPKAQLNSVGKDCGEQGNGSVVICRKDDGDPARLLADRMRQSCDPLHSVSK
jgi:hypothetical protein